MSDALLQRAAPRGGELPCVCDPTISEDARPTTTKANLRQGLVPLALANGFSVLAQALAVSTLPMAGQTLAPGSWAAALPFAALLCGAGLATLPAAYLTTGWDRRFGFALGASLGLAGACLAAWGFTRGLLTALTLGALWMGLAQGFGAFYRHGAAQAGGSAAIGLTVGSGVIAALLAPSLVTAATAAGPLLPAAVLLAAGAAQAAVLAGDLALPPPPLGTLRMAEGGLDLRTYALATAGAACAWFGMAVVMGGSPLRLADCGVAPANQSGLIAWHLVAMYLPALGALLIVRPGTRLPLLIAAALLTIGAAAGMGLATAPWLVAAALIAAGIGWSTASVAATSLLHAGGTPARWLLGLHDLAILLAAGLGAASATWMGLA